MEFDRSLLEASGSGTQNNENVPVYCSDESEEEEQPLEKKKRSKGKEYIFVKKFTNADEAESFVQAENTWSVTVSHDTEEGNKKFYRCRKVKFRGPQCAASIYLLFEANSSEVLLYRTDSDHDHESIATAETRHGICQETKEEINKLFALHLKPKAILNSLKKIQGMKLPSKKQLNNYLSDRRRVVYGSPSISLGELQAWLIENSKIPFDEHEPYVIAYHVYEGETPTFRFAISTKSLLKLTTLATNIHADATYKLIWQGFPVLLVGTTDKTKKFHPICIAVTTNERKQDFEMLFKALRNSAFTLYEHSLNPKALICDSAMSIINAFKEVFGEEAIIKMCWFHAKKNIVNSVERLVDKKKQKTLLQDIDMLQSATSPDMFQSALAAFMTKYVDQREFITYFKKEWVYQNRNWYLGSSKGSPITNNALESFNRSIKDCHTLRERFPLSRFLVVVSDMVKEWSGTYQMELFSNSPSIELKDWTAGYQWAKSDRKVVVLKADSMNKTYLIASSGESTIQFGEDWSTFDEYKQVAFAHWTIVLPINKEQWKTGECNCPQFFKDYICKHVIGLAIRLKYVTPPAEAKNIPIGIKRKRGRPSKARPALILQ